MRTGSRPRWTLFAAGGAPDQDASPSVGALPDQGASPPVRAALAAGVLLAALLLAAAAPAQAPLPPLLVLGASAKELTIGSPLALSGVLTVGETLGAPGEANGAGAPAPPSAPAGTTVALEADSYPYHGYVQTATTQTAPGGAFSFADLLPDRNTRMRVSASGTTSTPIAITVDPAVTLRAHSLGVGRVLLSARLRHARAPGQRPVQVWWFTAPRGSDVFALAAVTSTRESPSHTETSASATIDPPARRFAFRVCLNPGWEAAMGSPASHGPCPHHGFRLPSAHAHASLEYSGEGRGTPRPPYPSSSAIAAAVSYLHGRAGATALAVVNSAGRLAGVNMYERFQTASVVKVMFLVAYLQMRAAQRRGLDAADRALLYPMIHVSDNEAASAVLAAVGQGAVQRVARQAGMSAYAPGVGWWAYSSTDAADQARFFAQLGRLIPPAFYAYARELLSGIEPSQSWGFPPLARPAWRVFFKTGALPSEGLFHETALLERDGVRFTASVLTDGDPSMAYGEETIEGVARLLLAGRAP